MEKLLQDEVIRRWYTNLGKGSILTAKRRVALLGRFQDLTGVGPFDFLKMDTRVIEDMLIDRFDEFESGGFAPSYIVEFKKAIKSWLDFNNVAFNAKKIKVRSYNPRTDDEQVPTVEQLKKALGFASPKTKVMMTLMAFSFLRPQTLGKWDGSDGLAVKDLPEIRFEGGEVQFQSIPTMIVVRSSLSKAKQRYFSFLSSEGCNYLKDYLELRIMKGEVLESDSPILPGNETFMDTDSITKAIRRYLRKSGFSWRPYILRAYGATQLDIAEAKGLISHPWRQFFMGHKGDIESRYSTNKGRLPPDMIEEMRAAYKKCEPLLQTSKTESIDEDKLKDSFRKQLLVVAGFTQDEIEKMDMASMGDEEFQSIVKQKLLGLITNNGSKQKVIPVSDVETYISQR